MFRTVSFDPELERWVRQVEETPPATYAATLATALRFRVPEERLYLTGALGAARSLSYLCQATASFPTPILALHPALRAAALLEPSERLHPPQRVLTAINAAIHSTAWGPYRLPECEPHEDGSPEVTTTRFLEDVAHRSLFVADHRFVALARDLSPDEIYRVLLRLVLPRAVDTGSHGSHAVLYLEAVGRLMEWLGPEHREVLLRPLVHLLASMPHVPPGFDAARALAKTHRLGAAHPNDPGDAASVVSLRAGLGTCAPGEQAVLVAKALADGLSREDAWRALSLAATDSLLTLEAGRDLALPLYSGATVQALRWLTRGEEPPAQILALLQAANVLADTGARLRGLGSGGPMPVYPRPEDVDAMEAKEPAALLEMLPQALSAGDVGRASAIAQRYGTRGADPQPMLGCLARAIAAAEDEAKLSLPYFAAMIDAFEGGLAPDRATHLVALARCAAARPPS